MLKNPEKPALSQTPKHIRVNIYFLKNQNADISAQLDKISLSDSNIFSSATEVVDQKADFQS